MLTLVRKYGCRFNIKTHKAYTIKSINYCIKDTRLPKKLNIVILNWTIEKMWHLLGLP